jgi:hypothetical protein
LYTTNAGHDSAAVAALSVVSVDGTLSTYVVSRAGCSHISMVSSPFSSPAGLAAIPAWPALAAASSHGGAAALVSDTPPLLVVAIATDGHVACYGASDLACTPAPAREAAPVRKGEAALQDAATVKAKESEARAAAERLRVLDAAADLHAAKSVAAPPQSVSTRGPVPQLAAIGAPRVHATDNEFPADPALALIALGSDAALLAQATTVDIWPAHDETKALAALCVSPASPRTLDVLGLTPEPGNLGVLAVIAESPGLAFSPLHDGESFCTVNGLAVSASPLPGRGPTVTSGQSNNYSQQPTLNAVEAFNQYFATTQALLGTSCGGSVVPSAAAPPTAFDEPLGPRRLRRLRKEAAAHATAALSTPAAAARLRLASSLAHHSHDPSDSVRSLSTAPTPRGRESAASAGQLLPFAQGTDGDALSPSSLPVGRIGLGDRGNKPMIPTAADVSSALLAPEPASGIVDVTTVYGSPLTTFRWVTRHRVACVPLPQYVACTDDVSAIPAPTAGVFVPASALRGCTAAALQKRLASLVGSAHGGACTPLPDEAVVQLGSLVAIPLPPPTPLPSPCRNGQDPELVIVLKDIGATAHTACNPRAGPSPLVKVHLGVNGPSGVTGLLIAADCLSTLSTLANALISTFTHRGPSESAVAGQFVLDPSSPLRATVAGIFETMARSSADRMAPVHEISSLARDLSMPLVAFEDGRLRGDPAAYTGALSELSAIAGSMVTSYNSRMASQAQLATVLRKLNDVLSAAALVRQAASGLAERQKAVTAARAAIKASSAARFVDAFCIEFRLS